MPSIMWRSENQLLDTDEHRRWRDHEFPEKHGEGEREKGPIEAYLSRRSFLGIMGAATALATTAGCRKPVETIVPYVNDLEYHVQGVPEYFATAMPRGTSPLGILVEAHQGRPTKVEGNELHPTSGGGSDILAQASVLDLYDPDRAKYPTENGARRGWEEFVEFWRGLEPELKSDGGAKLAILIEPFASPTIARIRQQFQAAYPNARWVTWAPVAAENRDLGLAMAIGEKVQPVYNFDRATVILSLDSDFIMNEPDAVRHNRDFGRGRKLNGPRDSMNRLYIVESNHSVTGGKSDHRLRLQSRRIPAFTAALAVMLGRHGIPVPGAGAIPTGIEAAFDEVWLDALARDLAEHRGEGLVVAGLRQPPAVHALAAAINDALGNAGQTVQYRPYEDAEPSDTEALAQLASDIRGNSISTLVIAGANPVYAAPADLRFAEALQRVQNAIQISDFHDETAKLCRWHIPRSHFMESWGDVRASEGSLTVIQPQILPLYESHSDIELLNLVATGLDQPGYDLVRETWMSRLVGSDIDWQRTLHDGILVNTSLEGSGRMISGGGVASAVSAARLTPEPTGADAYEVVFAASPTVHDGRWANNAWLVELPDPVTKLTWINAAVMSPATAERIGVKTHEGVRVEVNGASVELPAYVLPGHADNSITLELGWGRPELGRVAATSRGVNVYPLRTLETAGWAEGASVARTGRKFQELSTQDHGSLEGRAIIREASLETYQHEPEFARHMVHVPDLDSLWKDYTYEEGYQWGMAIDLNACTNCNACILACQSENNIPTVGPDRVQVGREMHWMRLDRYFVGDQHEPRMTVQPMLCQHCEMAPCEQVCPVNATVHDSEGLNVMVYNRCIGTRYCSNNCPYKVRRFNFFNYTNDYPISIQMQQNPDVTVRSRGVMEKCTFCVQRITLSKQRAKMAGRVVKDEDLRTACQQACPPNAITFGNIRDPESAVAKLFENGRTYGVLSEFNTRPRVQYMAGVLNPNPRLPEPLYELAAAPHGGGSGSGPAVQDPNHETGGREHPQSNGSSGH